MPATQVQLVVEQEVESAGDMRARAGLLHDLLHAHGLLGLAPVRAADDPDRDAEVAPVPRLGVEAGLSPPQRRRPPGS
jgi:hypothetical protein